MELHTVDGMLAVAHAHHLAVPGARGDLEAVRHARCGERVVAAGLEALGQPGEDPPSVVLDDARLAVQERARTADLAAERLHDGLVAEADAERRHAWAERPDHLDGDP